MSHQISLTCHLELLSLNVCVPTPLTLAFPRLMRLKIAIVVIPLVVNDVLKWRFSHFPSASALCSSLFHDQVAASHAEPAFIDMWRDRILLA